MLRLPAAHTARPRERFALAVLADLARVLPAVDAVADAVSARVVDRPDGDVGALRRQGWGFTVADGEVLVPRAVLDGVVAVAGAGVEQGVTETDRYGRVPSARNPLVALGLEREPVVSECAAAFRGAVRRAAGRRPAGLLAPWPGGHRWAAALTHDLDVVDYWPAFTLLRLSELARRGHARVGFGVVTAALRALGRDPVARAALDLLEAERIAGVRSTWFVLCETPTFATMRAGDVTYRPEGARARRIVSEVVRAGHEIALHGSFATDTDAARFGAQRGRLAELVRHPVDGVRQHYIRMKPGLTHRAMTGAGFGYDASYGFPDRNGFRLGVADVVPAWDERDGRRTGLDEVPLVWMDRALSKYRNVEDPSAWVADALELADRCRATEGLWVGVWHPNVSPPLGFPGAPAAFQALLDGIRSRSPWIAPLREVVAWRRARRAARGLGLAPDGRVVLDAAADVALEDADGRAVASART